MTKYQESKILCTYIKSASSENPERHEPVEPLL